MKSEVFNGSRFWTYFKYDLTQMWRNHVKAAILIGFSGLILYILGIAFNAVFNQVWAAPGFGARVSVFLLACFALELVQLRLEARAEVSAFEVVDAAQELARVAQSGHAATFRTKM